jgi:hypothetical protein
MVCRPASSSTRSDARSRYCYLPLREDPCEVCQPCTCSCRVDCCVFPVLAFIHVPTCLCMCSPILSPSNKQVNCCHVQELIQLDVPCQIFLWIKSWCDARVNCSSMEWVVWDRLCTEAALLDFCVVGKFQTASFKMRCIYIQRRAPTYYTASVIRWRHAMLTLATLYVVSPLSSWLSYLFTWAYSIWLLFKSIQPSACIAHLGFACSA